MPETRKKTKGKSLRLALFLSLFNTIFHDKKCDLLGTYLGGTWNHLETNLKPETLLQPETCNLKPS